jgi:tetratricopeptide (TPR) repeat protein
VIRKSAICTCLLLGTAMAAMGQGPQENLAKCKSSKDPDVRIAGCTVLIQAGLLTIFQAGLIRPEKRSVIYLNRGTAYEEKGDHDRAVQDFDQAIYLNPKDEIPYYDRGYSYKKKGNYDRAIQDFTQALHLNPNFERAYYDRGNVYIDKDDYDRAIQEFDQAIRLNPKDPYAYNNRGAAYHKKGDYDRAIQDFNEAIQLNPNYTSAYFSRGSAYFAQSNLPAAIADFTHAISAAPSSNTAVYSVLMLHVIMKRQGHDDAQQLTRVAAAADMSKWPGPMLKLDLGQMTANEVMMAAARPGSDRLKWRVCEANYFTGEDALFHHQRATALALLKAAHDGCPKGDMGFAAMLELKRLNALAASAK